MKICFRSEVMPRKEVRWRIQSARQQLRQWLPCKLLLEPPQQGFRLTSLSYLFLTRAFSKNYSILVQRRRRRLLRKVKYFSYHCWCLMNRIKFAEGHRRQPQSEFQICEKIFLLSTKFFTFRPTTTTTWVFLEDGTNFLFSFFETMRTQENNWECQSLR